MEFYSGQPENPAASVRDYCTGVLKGVLIMNKPKSPKQSPRIMAAPSPKQSSSQITGEPRNRTRIEFTPINREYIYQLRDELNLSLSKVVNMLITESRNK